MLFFQVVTLIVAIFVFQVFRLEDTFHFRSVKHSIIIGILTGIAIDLCMSFSVNMGNGFLLDLRWIGFIIATLYGGTYSWLTCSILILTYRFYLGGNAAYTLPIALVFVTAVTFSIRKVYLNSPLFKKLTLSASASVAAYLFSLINLFVFSLKYTVLQKHFAFFAAIGCFYVATMVLGTFLVENVLESGRMRKNMIQNEKLRVVGELAASFAHEIRNPLTVAKGFAQLLDHSSGGKQNQYTKLIQLELDRAESIVTDYLTLAKPQAKKLEMLNLNQLLLKIINVMLPYATIHKVEITYSGSSELFIHADQFHFQQAVINLIKNAIEALPSGGVVTIRTSQYKNDTEITISDNGVGMTSEQMECLGKPFYTTKSKGTGLGLMVTYRLVEQMGGSLSFESTLGIGTNVFLRFPSVSIDHN